MPQTNVDPIPIFYAFKLDFNPLITKGQTATRRKRRRKKEGERE
jgi:hypothetical protein